MSCRATGKIVCISFSQHFHAGQELQAVRIRCVLGLNEHGALCHVAHHRNCNSSWTEHRLIGSLDSQSRICVTCDCRRGHLNVVPVYMLTTKCWIVSFFYEFDKKIFVRTLGWQQGASYAKLAWQRMKLISTLRTNLFVIIPIDVPALLCTNNDQLMGSMLPDSWIEYLTR